jgi:hypothetical protein
MIWLFTLSCRLSSVRQLRARRTGLLLRKSELLTESMALRMKDFAPGDGYALAVNNNEQKRCDKQIDAVNAELGRRGLV